MPQDQNPLNPLPAVLEYSLAIAVRSELCLCSMQDIMRTRRKHRELVALQVCGLAPVLQPHFTCDQQRLQMPCRQHISKGTPLPPAEPDLLFRNFDTTHPDRVANRRPQHSAHIQVMCMHSAANHRKVLPRGEADICAENVLEAGSDRGCFMLQTAIPMSMQQCPASFGSNARHHFASWTCTATCFPNCSKVAHITCSVALAGFTSWGLF